MRNLIILLLLSISISASSQSPVLVKYECYRDIHNQAYVYLGLGTDGIGQQSPIFLKCGDIDQLEISSNCLTLDMIKNMENIKPTNNESDVNECIVLLQSNKLLIDNHTVQTFKKTPKFY